MNIERFFFLIVVIGVRVSGLHAEVRKPTLPRGLTTDKSPTALPKARDERPRHLEHKRKGLQGIKTHYTFSDLQFEELKAAKDKKIEAKNYFIACKYLNRMITLCDDINEKSALMIELADIYFLQQSFDDAAKWYTEFAQLYPGNKRVEYASYRAVICSSKNMLSTDRDQSPTEKTLELAQDFLKREDLFATYKKEVKAIERECYHRLAASDLQVAEFYINKQHDYKSAEKRLSTIREEWIEKTPEIGVEIARLEVTLSELCEDFKAPEESIKLAQAVVPVQKKVSMADRF